MSDGYKPSFMMTEEITNLVIEIAEMTGMIALPDNLSKNPTLRRENRIHSIHSSLAIERNSLTINQVSDVIDGKRVLGPPKDIREVQNGWYFQKWRSRSICWGESYSCRDILTVCT